MPVSLHSASKNTLVLTAYTTLRKKHATLCPQQPPAPSSHSDLEKDAHIYCPEVLPSDCCPSYCYCCCFEGTLLVVAAVR